MYEEQYSKPAWQRKHRRAQKCVGKIKLWCRGSQKFKTKSTGL